MLLIAPRFTDGARADDGPECTPRVTITGSIGAAGDTPYHRIYDRDESTSISTKRNGWQYVQLDFACPVKVHELRRHMTRGGSAYGRREAGEGILYSLDGVRWRSLTADRASGWEDAEFSHRDTSPEEPGVSRYRGALWKGVPYGWSPRLRPASPIYARFVRFNWQAVGDSIHEIDAEYEPVHSTIPDLIWEWATWDWTEADLLLHVRYQGDTRDPVHDVPMPWNDYSGPCFQEEADVDPVDGWVLLAGDLGTNLLEPPPDFPYFFLYNKYRGLIRSYFFYGARYSAPTEATHQMGSLEFENGQVPAFTHHTGTTLDDYDPAYVQVFMKKHMPLNHWACLDFDVAGYDPDIASKSGTTFALWWYELTQSLLEAQGVAGLSGTLDAADLRTGKVGGEWDTIQGAAGPIMKAVSLFAGSEDAANTLAARIEAFHDDGNAQTWWSTAIAAGAPAAALSAGDVASVIADLGGFITKLVTGGSGSQVPLSWTVDLTGDLQINGTISEAPDLTSVRFYVPGSAYGSHPRLEPFYHQPLGVYALSARPTLKWYSRQPSGKSVNLDLPPDWVTVNPHAGLQLVSARAALVSRFRAPLVPLRDLDRYIFDSNVVLVPPTPLDSLKVGLLLELKRVGQPLAEPIRMYQEFEPDVVYDGVEFGPDVINP
jgi:hypothetical protein